MRQKPTEEPVGGVSAARMVGVGSRPRPCETPVSAHLGLISRHSRASGNPGLSNTYPRSPLSRGRRFWMDSKRTFDLGVPLGELLTPRRALRRQRTWPGGLGLTCLHPVSPNIGATWP